MGMMIVIAVVERTGIFQWSAYMAYRLSGGRNWLLVIILMIITGVASAFLDNVTTMLLMTPITIRIALSLGLNPLALLMPEVMASNVVGISTLVGTPTNILIGSYGQIGFNDFLTNLTPGVMLSLIGLVAYNLFAYRQLQVVRVFGRDGMPASASLVDRDSRRVWNGFRHISTPASLAIRSRQRDQLLGKTWRHSTRARFIPRAPAASTYGISRTCMAWPRTSRA